jgi:hypothetical protein
MMPITSRSEAGVLSLGRGGIKTPPQYADISQYSKWNVILFAFDERGLTFRFSKRLYELQ